MRRIALLMGAALVWPFAANAEINYNYMQIDWIADGELDIEGTGEADYDGFALEASGQFHPNFFVSGQANFTDVENLAGSGVDAAVDTLSLGIGGRLPVITGQTSLDLYGILSYDELDLGTTSDGWGVTGGVRWMPAPGIEINPFIGYVDYGELDGTSTEIDGERYGVRGIFNVTDQAAIVLDYRTAALEAENGGTGDVDFNDEIRVGGRWNFE